MNEGIVTILIETPVGSHLPNWETKADINELVGPWFYIHFTIMNTISQSGSNMEKSGRYLNAYLGADNLCNYDWV